MNACIVGYGAIGPIHADAFSNIPNAKLYAVCDILKDRADAGAKEYGTKAYYSFDDCIADENIDVIHICTPHYLHFEMICRALDSGKKVVVEKPAVMTKKEMDILFEKYDTSRIFPIVQNRKNTCIEELKRIVNEDESIGKLLGVKGILTWSRDADYYNSAAWRGTKQYEGGGVLINQAVHTLDLMMYFAGKARTVNAKMSNYSLQNVIDVEDTIDAFISYESGARGIFYATNAYCGNSPMQLEFKFENKSFKYIDGMLISGKKIICTDSYEYKGKCYWGSGHIKALHDYYQEKEVLTLADIKDTMDAMFAIYRSVEYRKEVKL